MHQLDSKTQPLGMNAKQFWHKTLVPVDKDSNSMATSNQQITENKETPAWNLVQVCFAGET